MARVIEILGTHTLEFATDYPHWDGDYDPHFRFSGIDPEVKAMILGGNAIHKYRLRPTRPARHWSEFPTGL
jgi:predicted TIM-barrel fold metal-dependent hydrolase